MAPGVNVMIMNHLFVIAQKAISMGLGWELTRRLLVYELPKLGNGSV